MANEKTALKPAPAAPKPVVRIACTVQGCGFAMPEGIALVPSIDAMQRLDGTTDGRLASIAKLHIAAHIVCPRCARLIRHAVSEVVFFNYLGTIAEIARRLKARAEREEARAAERKVARKAERDRGLSTAIGAFAGLTGGSVKTEGCDGRKLVGAAADAVVRKAITKIADRNETALREDAEKKAAREKAAADKKSALAERNSAMTLAAVAGGKR